ncbi:DUF6789 family protein [Mucilaginibacter sp. UYCu711]|uniref:DUF6789 family protein n=1 Tax=Mucilaginibacter sp. UYCu711 TaxID=3156339 RepID=UPI003D1A1AFB
MDSKKLKQALTGGIIATSVMTMIMLAAPMMGMPDMKIGNMMAGFMGIPVWLGWAMHLMIGIVWAMVYVFLIKDRLTLNPAIKGMLFALLPWILMQLMVMPMMGMGVFSANSPNPVMMVVGTMMGHLVYGLVLGLSTKGE